MSTGYRRILVPVDGSSTAARGLREAIRLAKDMSPLLAGLARSGRAVLERARRTAEKSGFHAQTAIYEAAGAGAADTILRDARKWRADLIVIGTHGRRGLRRLVLGSDAEQVVRLSAVPVLLVRGRGG